MSEDYGKSKSYEDIIDLPHHVSKTRPKMSMENRAAQFSPFAALTGYDAAVKETSRITDKRVELDENEMAIIDMKLNTISDRINQHPEVEITYFKADAKKDGGSYVSVNSSVKKINIHQRTIVLEDNTEIKIDDVLEVNIDVL